MHRTLLALYFLLTTTVSHAQELAYRQFTVKDGLPGAIVYHCIQDRKGFIWFATNQGVCRFDGRTFHTFTKKDGLPDNEILQLYLDRFDNVWFISFVGIPSVMHGDSIIRFDQCPGVNAICEDQQTNAILLIADLRASDQAGCYRSPDSSGRWKFNGDLHPRALYARTGILRATAPDKTNFYFSSSPWDHRGSVLVENSHVMNRFPFQCSRTDPPFTRQLFFSLLPSNNSIVFLTYDSAYLAGISQLSPLFSLHTLGLNMGGYNNFVNCVYYENDSTLWLCARSQGLLRLTNFRSGHPTVRHFFPRSDCTDILKDREGGYWVTTLSDGIFYLPNLCFSTLPGPPDLRGANVRSLHILDSRRLVAGFDDGNIMLIDRNSGHWRLFPHWSAGNENNRIMDVRPYLHQSLLVAADMGLHRLSPDDTHTVLSAEAYKETFVRPDHTIVAGCSAGLYFFDDTGRQLNWIGPDRVTCVAGLGNAVFWGGLKGVYAWNNGHITQPIPALSGVINHIDIAPDTALWVSTEDGLVIWKAGAVRRITKAQDLASDLCKQVSFEDNTAWVATDKGISRIDYRWQDTTIHYDISNITNEDGLLTDDINRTAIAGGYVWTATSRGVCFFPKTYTGGSAAPPGIVITRIIEGGQPVNVSDIPVINYSSGKLLIEMACISYRSGFHVGYEYRLKGADSNWFRLAGNTIEFPALPFGRFVLELRSIDRWGSRSHPITIPIVHPYPFYWSPVFLLMAYPVIVLLIGAGILLYFRRRQRKKEKIHDLELSALRAQMNPHFIFNCLTSIQYHVLRADVMNANDYLHKFSNLIRLTLDHSSSAVIPLYEEIKMLHLYLELEQLRLGPRMNYRLVPPDPSVAEGLSIPPMIIQPFVENAVQHGIAPLKDRTGELSVAFHLSPGYLHCTIEDNGGGIDSSRARQRNEGHISQGSGITGRRIQTLNAIHKQQIILDILDKNSAGLSGSGTIVNLSFPINTD
ncbi:sensor histidine kinase [Dinghuibacter silviterrae]|uniref:Histidine kinase n=1 Tax=Dinghuibacter silviterrae TaxID=1539049 RepID=A0A4R8DMH3_9BACT|nr:histidine kinase [Dinghuibacter silviterrae]TDW99189.1 histidine kinase [Dinghuibacter silviterrae]